jgi:uncharacterized coiled-coil protein SlyX
MMTGNITSLVHDLAGARAELAEVERITSYEIGRLNGQIAAVEQRIVDARLAGEREIARLNEQIAESKQRLAVSRDKLTAAQERFEAARAAS